MSPAVRLKTRLGGLLARSRWRFWRHVDLLIERISGLRSLDTERRAMLDDLGVAAPGRLNYQPSRYISLRRGLRGAHVTSDDVFLDYGCGKGRVLAQAARGYPFGRVLGVEISAELAEVARANLVRARSGARVADDDVVVADAASWPLPDDVTYVYMYRPFTGKVFETVIGRIIESLERRPRRLTLIYVYPELEEVILRTGRFTRARTFRSAERSVHHRVSVFVSEPARP